MLLLTWYGAKALRFGREDRIAIQFAGSKKSLAAGLPMASVLFGAHASLAVLPLMLFHQMQLMVCAVIAKRRSHDPAEDVTAPEGSGRPGSEVGAGTRSG
ncbi:putative Na+-dependent transporter [Streptomyces calvus]